jgi:hypothetical protein
MAIPHDATIDQLRFPVGRFEAPATITPEHISAWIEEVAALPSQFRDAAVRCSEAQLETPYREGGWRVRQVIHHLPDSHINCYVRFRWALTEDRPAIKVYDETAWAELPDAAHAPIEMSLKLLEAVHARWVELLRRMQPADFAREFIHTVSGPTTLARALGMYAWHGRHHLAHIKMVLGEQRTATSER